MNLQEPAISIRGLHVVRGGRDVLPEIDLDVERGSVTGLLGPSGSGKTTLIRSIVGVQIVEGGDLTVLGRPAGAAELRRHVGYVTQAPAVYTDLTVRENLTYFARIVSVGRPRVDEVLERVGLADHAGQPGGSLSGGEIARVSLATALLHQPELLLLDEPTVGLDPVLRRDLWDFFRELADRRHDAARVEPRHGRGRALRPARPAPAGPDPRRRVAAGAPRAHGCRQSRRRVPATGPGEPLMPGRATVATAARVLAQLRRDPRTLALLIVVPCVLVFLVDQLLVDQPQVFQRVGVPLLGLFPLISMFLVTSITMLRERTTGTLERLLTLPLAKLDLLLGYGIAFAAFAAVQATIVSLVGFGLLGLESGHSTALVVALAVANAVWEWRSGCS